MKASRHVDAPVLQTLEPYPEMKDSGVPALGNIPVHWQVLRVKNLCRMRSGDGITAESITPVGAYPVYGGNGQRGYTSEYTHDGTFVLIGRQGALCGNVHLARGRFWASEHAVVTTVRSGYLPEWLGAILTVMDLNQYSIAAAQPGLSVERVLDLRLPVTPVSEQAAIVRFLDHADRHIRRYIRAKQKLIALLEEQKQAVIHRAVTRGLDPNVRLKPSGVEWLGDVPEHWKTERAKWLFRKMEQPVRENDEVVTCFRDGVVTLRKNRRVRGFTESLKEIGYQGVRRGDLVIHAMDAFAGAIGVSDSDGKGTPVYSVCSPRQSANAYYYAFCVREMARSEWILALAKGIRERSTDFRFKDFASQWVPLLPLPEQAAIVSFLDRATADLDAATTSAQRETSLIREYHTCLIADVVTGKLDVREAAAGLPDEVKEPERFDETSALIDGEEEPSDDLDAVPEEAEV